MMPFGECLLLWRLERRLTQTQLAERAGLPRPNLSAIERGKRDLSLTTLRCLALALDIQPGVLVDGIPPQNPKNKEPLSRQDLERIAQAVVTKKPLTDPRERDLAEHIRHLANGRIRALGLGKAQGSHGRSTRAAERAWLASIAQESPQVIQTLLDRVVETYGKL